jgi:beta-mannanase
VLGSLAAMSAGIPELGVAATAMSSSLAVFLTTGASPSLNRAVLGQWETYTKRKANYLGQYSYNGSAGIDSPSDAAYYLSATNRPVIFSLYMCDTTTTNLSHITSGSLDSYFTAAAAAFIGYIPKDPNGLTYVRLGWEFNLGGFPWAVGLVPENTSAAFVAAFRRIVRLFRAVSASFRFVWCPGNGNGADATPIQSYPGDDYVDVIGVDAYQFTKYGIATWADQLAYAGTGVTYWYNFSQCYQHRKGAKKPFCVGEWATSDPNAGNSDATGADYVTAFRNWCAGTDQGNVHRNIAYHSWYDSGPGESGGYDGYLDNNQYPLTGAAYRAAFAKNL